jgi:ribosomal-protein-alanine N-acetyltransferase
MADLLARPQTAEHFHNGRYTVSSMMRSDIPDVMRLEKQVCNLPWNANAYLTEIGNPNAKYLITKFRNGDLVGYGGVWVVMDEMHITTLAVDPIHRGNKIAERLMIHLIFAGIERGATRATLEVREGNTAARNLYHKFEFEDVAMRKKYYSDNNENAIIMWAEEIDSERFTSKLSNRLREIEALHGS